RWSARCAPLARAPRSAAQGSMPLPRASTRELGGERGGLRRIWPSQPNNTRSVRMFRDCARSRGSDASRAVKLRQALSSQELVKGAVAALRRRQAPALGCDCPALDAIGVVDDHINLTVLGRVLGNLVRAGGTHPAPGFGDLTRDALLHADVVGSVVAGCVAADEHGGELVEGIFAVGLDVGVLGVAHEHGRLIVAVPVRPPRQPALADLLQTAERAAEAQALLQRLARVSHLPQLASDRGLPDRA